MKKRHIVGIVICTALLFGSATMAISLKNKATAHEEVHWKSSIMKESYDDPVCLLQDQKAVREEFSAFIDAHELTVREKNALLQEYREQWEAVLDNSTVSLAQASMLDADQTIETLESFLQEKEDYVRKQTGGVYQDSDKKWFYTTRQQLKWLKEDRDRIVMLEAWAQATKAYFYDGFSFDSDREETVRMHSQQALEEFKDPGDLPEEFAGLLGTFISWQEEINRLSALPEYNRYFVGKGQPTQFIIDEVYIRLTEQYYQKKQDIKNGDIETVLKKAIEKNT